MTHENNNIGGRAEHPGSDEQKISQLLGGLKRVEAPGDFEFHVKARIAKARPSEYQRTSFFPILKYAMPLGLFLAVGAGMLFYNANNGRLDTEMVREPGGVSNLEPSQQNSLTVVKADEPKENESITPNTAPTGSGIRTPETKEPFVASNPKRPGSVRPGSSGSRDFTTSRGTDLPGNSTDMTVRVAANARTLPGLPSNEPMGVSESLRLIDAEGNFQNDTWVVKSVKANGIADQMGLKAGDRLRTIDGKPVTEKMQFQRSFSAGTIRVERNGSIVEIGAQRRQN